MKSKNIEIHFNSLGSSGNIFSILAKVREAMRKQHRISEYNDMWQAVQNSGSYAEAIREIRKHVTLIDDDGDV